MSVKEKIQLEQLMELALRSKAVSQQCICAIASFEAWERVPLSFPESQMHEVGTLADSVGEELTFAEFHPSGTNYWSRNAPIAVQHFPYNRCSVWTCTKCGRCCLRYTEGGGYYVEQRIRELNPELIVNQPL